MWEIFTAVHLDCVALEHTANPNALTLSNGIPVIFLYSFIHLLLSFSSEDTWQQIQVANVEPMVSTVIAERMI